MLIEYMTHHKFPYQKRDLQELRRVSNNALCRVSWLVGALYFELAGQPILTRNVRHNAEGKSGEMFA